ncbi:MAG: hypothetical protein SNJ54_16020 [Anaerolineae bacterium]
MTTTELDILKQAREAILAKNYGLARMLLNTIPREPRAQKWLAKLDEIAPDEADIHSGPTFGGLLRSGDSQRVTTVQITTPPAPPPPTLPVFEPEARPGTMPRAAALAYGTAGVTLLLTLVGMVASAVSLGLTSAVVLIGVVGAVVSSGLMVAAMVFQYLNALLMQQKRTNDLLTRIEQHLR